jgi:hypothetical protein
MSLPESPGFALVVLKSAATRYGLRQLREQLVPHKYIEDDHLVLCRIGGNAEYFDQQLERVISWGWSRALDFAVVNGEHGVQGLVPPWLGMVLEPSGNPPELEAKMDPEVREMWQQTRRLTYFLRASEGHQRANGSN